MSVRRSACRTRSDAEVHSSDALASAINDGDRSALDGYSGAVLPQLSTRW